MLIQLLLESINHHGSYQIKYVQNLTWLAEAVGQHQFIRRGLPEEVEHEIREGGLLARAIGS